MQPGYRRFKSCPHLFLGRWCNWIAHWSPKPGIWVRVPTFLLYKRPSKNFNKFLDILFDNLLIFQKGELYRDGLNKIDGGYPSIYFYTDFFIILTGFRIISLLSISNGVLFKLSSNGFNM